MANVFQEIYPPIGRGVEGGESVHKKSEIGVGIGSTSIIMVFVVLCLTTFGVLALVTVDGEYKLTQKTAESITHFYEADSQAEELLAQIDGVLVAANAEIQRQGDLRYIVKELCQIPTITLESSSQNQIEVSYQIPVDERQKLAVRMQINPYEMSKESRYTLLEWAVRPGADWEYESIEFEDIRIEQ